MNCFLSIFQQANQCAKNGSRVRLLIDLDIVGSDTTNTAVVWWENDGASPRNFTQRTIDNSFGDSRDIAIGDIDRNGILDVVSVDYSSDLVAWWKKTGSVFTRNTINSAFTDPTSVAVGDLDGDEELDLDDLETLENMILPLTQSARQEYVECADYDLDEDVDEDDLTCLTNVIAQAWYGDLNGGVCFDAVYDSPLKGDLDGDSFITEACLIFHQIGIFSGV